MPHGLERRQQTGQLHFITFSCYRRLPFLQNPDSKNTLEQVIEKTRRSHSLTIYAYVLMPEHVHLLTSEPETHTLPSFMRVIKGESSKLLKDPRERFWQTRYYDFNTFTTGKFTEKIQYIHRNPVTRGLVSRPEDYRWSSFNHYATGTPLPSRSNPNGPPQNGWRRAHTSKPTHTSGWRGSPHIKPTHTSGAPFMRSHRMSGSFERSSNRLPQPTS